MAIVSEELKDSIKTKILGSQSVPKIPSPVSSESTETSNVSLKILGKNMMSLPGIARDMNVARQNVQKLVKIMGGEAATGADAHMLKESERGAKFDVESAKEKEKIQKVERVDSKEDSKKPSFFEKMKNKIKESETFKKLKDSKGVKKVKELKDKFSQNKFVKAFTKYFKLIVIFGLLFLIFKDAIVEWAKGLYETIKEKFDEFVGKIKEWFNEVVQPIIDKVMGFIMPIVEKIGEFFKSIGDWFVDKFGFIGEWFTNTFSFVGKIVDKFKAMIEAVKENLKELYEKAPSAIKKLVPDFVVKFIGAKTEKEKEEEKKKEELQKRALANVVDDSKEAQKLQRQQGEAQRAEAERADIPRRQEERQKRIEERDRVAALEKEKQYTGTDEIVRARLGLPSVAASEMKIEEVTEPRTPLAPTAVVAEPQKAPSAAAPSAPSPAAKGGKEEPVKTQGGTPGLIVEALKEAGINSPKAHANVLATVKAESNFKVQSENLNYSSAERIKSIFGPRRIPSTEFAQQFVKNPEALANHVYKTTDGNSEPGDGFKYRGRGFIQHTGKNQYAAISKATGVNLLSNPDALNSPEVAAKAIPWFFLGYKRMKPEDMDNMSKVNKAVGFAGGAEYAAKREESAKQIYAQMQSSPGTEVASASQQVAVSHREQIKPQTPVVVNAPVTNNNVTQTNQTLAKGKPNDSSNALVGRVA